MEELNTQNYNVDSIELMTDIEHIRHRPGMYVDGVLDPRQLFSEAFDNALDESQSGYSDLTEVFVDTKTKVYRIQDRGRGIPIGKKTTQDGLEMETLEVLVTKSFSGGKFSGKNYKLSSGLHGVGLCCCNALSEDFKIRTVRDGKSVTYTSSRGETKDLVYEDTDLPNGVSIEFKADSTIYEDIRIPLEFIENRCRTAKAFGYNINLYVDGELVNIEVEKLSDLLPAESNNIFTYNESDFTANIESGEFMRVVLKYTSDTHSRYFGYTNLLFNKFGGTHIRLVNKAINEVWEEFYKEIDTQLKWDDCTVGLRSLVAVFISETAFSSQTKDKLTVKAYVVQPLIDKFKEVFRQYLIDHPEIRKALLNRFAEYRNSQNRLTSRKEIMELVKVNGRREDGTVKRRSVVPGLIECTSSKLESSELFIVEGNSAGGSAARARNRTNQSVLPLRGKIKNVAYMSIKDALKSEDVRKVINAIGAGVGDETDPSKCRYEKVIFSPDADSDGLHIANLLICLAVNLLAPLVKAGRIYVVEAPLYSYLGKDKKRVYTDDFDSIPANLRSTKGFIRYKGLGEMDDDEYKESCMDPNGGRRLYRVEYPDDIEEFNRIMGTTGGRRELLEDKGLIRYVGDKIDDTDEM